MTAEPERVLVPVCSLECRRCAEAVARTPGGVPLVICGPPKWAGDARPNSREVGPDEASRTHSTEKEAGMNPGDRIESDVRAIALPRGRRVGQPGHDVAREYLRGRLEEIGLEPFWGDSFELPFERPHPLTGTRTEFTNLIGVVPGSKRDLPPVLVGAHYDSVIDAPCADDNATSVAVALAAAESFVAEPLERRVVIALFDSEEPPYFHEPGTMGSTRFYEDHCEGVSFACALIMDLISHDVELGFVQAGSLPQEAEDRIRKLLFVTGAESGPHLSPAVETAAARVGELNVVPTLNSYVGDMSDQRAFRLGGEPYLFLSCGQGRYYHHELDSLTTPGWINFEKTRRVHELVVELLREVDSRPDDGDGPESGATPGPKLPDPIDTTEFEIRRLEAAFGPLLPAILRQVGLTELRTREDIDRIAAALRGTLLR